MRHGAGLGLNSLYYLPLSLFLSHFFLSVTRSLSGQEAKLVYVKRLCFFPPLFIYFHLSLYGLLFTAFIPLLNLHPFSSPSFYIMHHLDRLPSRPVHTELCRIGFLLLSDLLKKSLFTSFTFHLS